MDLREELDAAEAALDRARTNGDERAEAAALITVAKVSLAKENTRKALKSAQKALSISSGLGDVAAQLEALQLLASAHLTKRDAPAAIKVAREMQALCKRQGDRRGEAAALKVIYEADLVAGLGHEAMRVAYETMVIYRDAGDRQAQLMMLEALCGLLLEQKMATEALEMAREALDIARDQQLRQHEGTALFNIAKANLASKEGLAAAASAVKVFKELGLRKDQASALHAVANGCLVQKLLTREALAAAAEGLGLYKEEGDRHGEAIMLHTIANCQLALREPQKSVGTAYEALYLFEATKDQYGAGLARKLLAGAGQSEGTIRERLEQWQQSGRFDGLESTGQAEDLEEKRRQEEELRVLQDEQVLWEVTWVPLETQDPKNYGGDKHTGTRRVLVTGQLRDPRLVRKLTACRRSGKVPAPATFMYNLLNGRLQTMPSLQSALLSSDCAAVVYDVTMLNNLGPLEVIDVAIRLVQALQTIEERKVALDIITESAQALGLADEMREPFHSSLWGFSRTARVENPQHEFRCLDIDAGRRQQNLAFICRYLLGAQATRPAEVVLRGGLLQVARVVGSRTQLQLSMKVHTDRGR